jgi:hypothetical protein
MQESEPRQHWDALKLGLQRIPSADDFRRRFLWPRGPHRSSAVPAPGSFYFPHALRLWRKISNPSSTIHPVGEPSGVVPGVIVSGRCLRLNQRCGGEGLDRFFLFSLEVLFVIFQGTCAISVQAKVLFVIVPTVQ